jgi:hypothetical protein
LLVGLTAVAVCVHQAAVVVVEVDAVRVHGALAHQPEAVVDLEVGTRMREQLARPGHLVLVLGDMRMDPGVGVLRRQFAGTAQLRVGARRREARRDGVAQAVDAVPLPDERLGVGQALRRLVAHAVGRMAVLQHLAGDHAQSAALGRCEEGLHRGDVRGREGQRRGHAVAQQLVEEDLGHRRRVGGLGEAALGGKGVVLQPWQQAVGRRADDVGLWEVDVHVHEARRQDAARPVRDGRIGMPRRHGDVGARVDHALAAVGIGCDDQQAVFVELGTTGVVESQEGGAVGSFHRVRSLAQDVPARIGTAV